VAGLYRSRYRSRFCILQQRRYKNKKPRQNQGFLNGQLQLISLQTATKPYHQFASDVFKVSTLKALCKYQSKKGDFYIFNKEYT